MAEHQYGQTALALRRELDRISEEDQDEFDAASAFSLWVAEEYEQAQGERAVQAGPGAAISFLIRDPHDIIVYSCKVPEDFYDSVEAQVFGEAEVSDFVDAMDAVVGERTLDFKYLALNRLVDEISKEVHLCSDSLAISGSLVLMGELDLAGRQALEMARRSRPEMTLDVITWNDIAGRLDGSFQQGLGDLHFDVHVESLSTDVLRQRDWLVALVYARDLVFAMERFGVQLFDLNVRQELAKSKINREILSTLRNRIGRRCFHHLNNGILIACNGYQFKDSDRIRLHGPQVINGCQTVSSLRRAYASLTEEDRQDFDRQVRVQVKVLQRPAPDLLDEIVISTNNQNPMKPRNLRSNTYEQRLIQQDFRGLQPAWFYVRKDGEFEALCENSRAKWFRRSHYEIPKGGPHRFRTLDNLSIAKDWYAWIGAAPAVLRGGNDFFGDELLYRRIFRLHPTSGHWSYYGSSDYKLIDEGLLEPSPPSAGEYLFASSFGAYIRARGTSPYSNKREALHRALSAGALSGNLEIGNVTSSPAEQAAYLASDEAYRLNNYLNNMEDVLVELASYAVGQLHGPEALMEPASLLDDSDLFSWASSGWTKLPPEDGLLAQVYDMVKCAATSYCRDHADEIAVAPRPKMFFGRRETIQAMREYL